MNDYRKHINNFKFEGIKYRTFINDDADMVIRYNEIDDNNYTDLIFNASAKLIKVIDVTDGNAHIQK